MRQKQEYREQHYEINVNYKSWRLTKERHIDSLTSPVHRILSFYNWNLFVKLGEGGVRESGL